MGRECAELAVSQIELSQKEVANAIEAANRMLVAVESARFNINATGDSISKTVSIGVASLSGTGDTIEALLKRADEALYQAKNGGRNQVVSSDS